MLHKLGSLKRSLFVMMIQLKGLISIIQKFYKKYFTVLVILVWALFLSFALLQRLMNRLSSYKTKTHSHQSSPQNTQSILASHNLNDLSSRSHTIFCLTIESQDIAHNEMVTVSKLQLVDLAGSEKQALTGTTGV